MIPKDGWLQVFHSAFVSDEWVYASTSCSGVDDCWMRIPVKSLLNPMKSLDLNLWQEKGVPVARRKLPTFRGLTNKSRSLPKFLDKNKLIEVPMDVAKTLPVRPVPSSFQESCTEFWSSMRDPRKMTRVFPWHHTIHYKHCNNLVVPPVWTQNLIISFISWWWRSKIWTQRWKAWRNSGWTKWTRPQPSFLTKSDSHLSGAIMQRPFQMSHRGQCQQPNPATASSGRNQSILNPTAAIGRRTPVTARLVLSYGFFGSRSAHHRKSYPSLWIPGDSWG